MENFHPKLPSFSLMFFYIWLCLNCFLYRNEVITHEIYLIQQWKVNSNSSKFQKAWKQEIWLYSGLFIDKNINKSYSVFFFFSCGGCMYRKERSKGIHGSELQRREEPENRKWYCLLFMCVCMHMCVCMCCSTCILLKYKPQEIDKLVQTPEHHFRTLFSLQTIHYVY